MSAHLKEVLLVGFGAVGAVYSLALKRSGLARVTAVARSNHDIVKDQGIHFYSRKLGDIQGWKPDRLCKSVVDAADQPYSYVVVTTKAIPELTKTPKILAPLLAKAYTEKFQQPTYVLLQNGLNVEVDLYNALRELGLQKTPRIISSAVYIETNLKSPNVVEYSNFGRVHLGAYRHRDYLTTTNTKEEEVILHGFADPLEAGGSKASVVPEIQRAKFMKNFWNVAFASIATLTRQTLPAIYRPPPKKGTSLSCTPYVSPITAHLISEYTIPAIRGTLQEVLSVGRALGFPDTPDGLPASTVEAALKITREMNEGPDNTHRPSMLLDVEKGRPFEVEAIVGEVVRMAKDRGVAIPRLELLYSLLLVIQNQLLRGIGDTL